LEVAFVASLILLLVWILLSNGWTQAPTETPLEGERMIVYVAGVLAAFLLVGRYPRALLAGVWMAATLVSCYSLLTRLFPERVGTFDVLDRFRLSEPVGYWNALGIFAVIGALLAFGLAADAQSRLVRALATASTVVLLPTVYFTYSRGAWIALGLGLIAMVAVSPQRLRLVTIGLLTAPWPAAGVLLSADSRALTHRVATLDSASRAGHHLAFLLLLLALGAIAVSVALSFLELRLQPGHRVRVAYSGVLVLIVAVSLTAVFSQYGSPISIANRAYDSFKGSQPPLGTNLNARLFSFSSNGRVPQWRIAWGDFKSHPWLGSGAGSYEVYWNRHRPTPFKIRDAHSLYLETLAELGAVGFALLMLALALPFAAVIKARNRPLAAAAFGAYVAYLAHAGIDWDWEMTAITLAALFCGVSLLISARREEASRPMTSRTLVTSWVIVAALGTVSFIGLMGNRAQAGSESAFATRHWAEAESKAREAIRWAPWSSDGWRALGWAQKGGGKPVQAARSFRKAISKNRGDYDLWLSLAFATKGREQRAALAHVKELNPRLDLRAEFYEIEGEVR
jgi:hypothetical protein